MTTAATRNGRCPDTPGEAAAYYVGRGLSPIPLPTRGKRPVIEGWPDLRLTLDAVAAHFPEGEDRNIGLLLGAASGGLIDVDLDEPEAIRAAPFFLPPTGWKTGRQSKPRSHWWYVAAGDAPDKASEQYKDIDGAMLAELRSTGGQTVAPPGVHESGERIGWYDCTDPARVAAADLRRAVAKTAAAALLARHWPAEGGRQDAALALAGGLARAGWAAEAVETFIRAVATAAGDDELEMRADAAARTVEKVAEGGKATGWPKLAEALGERGKAVGDRVREWLGLDKVPAAVADVTPEAAPWPDPPAEEAYHGLAGRIVRVIEPASEADPAALLVQILVAFGNAVGRSAHFIVEGDVHRGNEFAVLVGKTSKARKGTSWGRVERLFRDAEEQWAAEHVATGLSSGQGVIWHVRDPIVKRERIREKGEVRYEDVEADPGVEDKRLLIVEPEFASCLKLTEQKESTLSPVLRNAWDGRDLRILNKNSPTRATGAHVSLIGHITAEELRRSLTATEAANGFGNRFLWLCVARSKHLPEGGVIDPAAMDALRGELVEALAFARTADVIHRDDEARDLWRQVYGELSEGKPGLAGGATGPRRGPRHASGAALRAHGPVARHPGGTPAGRPCLMGLRRAVGLPRLRRQPRRRGCRRPAAAAPRLPGRPDAHRH